VRSAADVSALASLTEQRLCVLIWNYHDDDLPGPEAPVALSVTGLAWSNGVVRGKHYRIDATHSNAYEFWKRLGSPQSPTTEQYDRLEKAGRLDVLESRSIRIEGGQAHWRLALPRQAVSLLVFER
jgi:xylan 1,4-beta-xylosidase